MSTHARPARSAPLPTTIKRVTLHTGKKYDYEQIVVRMPSGNEVTRQYVKHPGAVVIVPVLPDGRIVLVRVYRHTLERLCLECCAGTLEAGEDPAACAGRELIEETGYRAARVEPLGAYYTSPGLSDELMRAFVATGLTHVGQHLEEDEFIDVVTMTREEALAAVMQGELTDAKSMVALLMADRVGRLM